jgi:hypothetical protein
MNVGGVKYNQAAVLSRQLQHIVEITASAYTAGQVIDSHTQPLDPNCPFFYLFAAGGTGTDLGFYTTFEFSNGGSVCTSKLLAWGNSAALDAGRQSTVNVLTTQNDGYIYFHDIIGGACTIVAPLEDQQGTLTRWTALADSVKITTVAVNTVTPALPYGVVTGIIQQPW